MKVPAAENDHIPENEICFSAIGIVQNDFEQPTNSDEIRAAESLIRINPELSDALQGMQPGQSLLVLYYFHRSEGGPLRQHPRGDTSRAVRGVFTLRTPHRPNPIGLTEVKLISIEGSSLRVQGLDAIHGSPVLDIKPS
jgi:L-fuculose-phosphate aldolase